MVVVLPAPLGPSSANTSLGRNSERDAEQRLRLAVEGIDAGDLEDHANLPEVGALDPLVLLQLTRRAPGDHLAPVDDRDAVGKREQERHVVLDGDDGEHCP